MSGSSAIEWTDTTWNPVTGCDRVSPGCAHCYALELAGRLKRMGQAKYQRDGDPKTSGPGFGVTLHPSQLERPLRWRKPRMVFVNSMSDLFHQQIPDGFIAWVFWVMQQCPQHIFQVLTKRPERMRDFMTRWADRLDRGEDGELENRRALARGPEELRAKHNCGRALLMADMLEQWGEPPEGAAYPTYDWLEGPITWPDVPDNVWLGVSIENRRFVHRADLLRETPAAVRFVSAEPLLGPLLPDSEWCMDSEYELHPHGDAPYGAVRQWADEFNGPGLDLEEIDWLIAGGESGAQHRPIDPDWVRELRDYCQEECWQGPREGTTAFFFKQWGGRTPKAGGRELDGRTWDEMPMVLGEQVA